MGQKVIYLFHVLIFQYLISRFLVNFLSLWTPCLCTLLHAFVYVFHVSFF